MIIHFYQKHVNLQFTVYSLLITLLWIDAAVFPQKALTFDFQTPVYNGLVNLLQKIPSVFHVILAFIVLLIQAVVLNSSLIRYKIITRNTFLPALIYVVLMSYTPEVQTIHPLLAANLFLIFSFNLTLGLYLKPEPYKEIFNATFLISLASLFYLPALIFIILFWLSLLIYRISAIREWIISFSGMIAPYLFVAFYYYWNDSFGVFLEDYLNVMFRFHPLKIILGKPLLTEIYLVLGGLILIILIISLIKISIETTGKLITIRKRLNVILYSVFIAAISFIWADDHLLTHATIMAIPACILFAYFFTGIKRMAIAEVGFTILILLIVVLKLIHRIEV